MHPETTPDWLPERAMYDFADIRPRTTALLVIDMQIVFVEEGHPATGPYSAAIVPNINRLAKTVRDAGGHVAFTRHTIVDAGPEAVPGWQRERPTMAALLPFFRDGMREHGVDGSMDVQPGDIVLNKHRFSAFGPDSSAMHAELQARGIDTVIVTGVVTNCCCETTARDANALKYKTFFVKDATAALSDEEHNAALLNLCLLFADVRDTDGMVALIEAARDAAD